MPNAWEERDMKRILLATTALILLAAAPAPAQQKSVKIGFVSTFSGPTAVIGNDMRNSFELALDHMGRKMGGLPVEVIYEDDQQKPDVGKQKTEKLVQSDKVDFIVGYIWSNVLLASLKSAVDNKTILISANAGPSQLAGELCSPYVFSTSWQNDQTPQAMGLYMNQKGVKSVFLIGPNYAAGKDMLAGVKSTFKGEVKGEEYPGLRPTFYGAQSYDAAGLINSAVVAVKGDMTKKDAMKAEMEKANFKSVRGPFKYGNNHIPVQTFYLQDVVKDAEGQLALKTVTTIVKDSQDNFHDKCPMK